MTTYSDLQNIWPLTDPEGPTGNEIAVKKLFRKVFMENLTRSLEEQALQLANPLQTDASATAERFLLLVLKHQDQAVWQMAVEHEKKRERKASQKLMDVLDNAILHPPTDQALDNAKNAASVSIDNLPGFLKEPVKTYIDGLKAAMEQPAQRYLMAVMLQEVAK